MCFSENQTTVSRIKIHISFCFAGGHRGWQQGDKGNKASGWKDLKSGTAPTPGTFSAQWKAETPVYAGSLALNIRGRAGRPS